MSQVAPTLDLISAPVPPPAYLGSAKDEEKNVYSPYNHGSDPNITSGHGSEHEDDIEPTEEEYEKLRKVPATIHWPAIALCLVEIAERASYYGSKKPFANFVRGALPKGGNGAGAVAKGAAGKNQTAGALGMGSVAASAVTSTFTFLSYVIPILGGIIADTKWGRWKTICVGVAIGAIAHVILVIPAIPAVIASGHAFPPFMISVIILAFAAGFIKPSLAPLMCDQSPVKKPVIKTTKSGERVIVDPQVTVQRYMLIFYWCINIGSFWMIVESYVQRLVGFWLAYLLPAGIYVLVPLVMLAVYKRLYFAPPQGSVLLETLRVIKQFYKENGFFKGLKGGDKAWESIKPSHILEKVGTLDKKIVWDDRFVEEVRQALEACSVFWLLPIYYLADGGIGNMENDMSAAMTLNNIPNDLFSNCNPLCIIVFTPIIGLMYRYFEKIKRPIRPMTRLSIGFALASINMIIGALVQWRIYSTSPCGHYATDCEAGVSPIPLAWMIPLSALPGIGEIFIAVTAYEIAYTRAPARMKGLVVAISLFNQAISAAIGLALSDVIKDPYLIWPYVALAVANFICIFICPTVFRHLNEPIREFANVERMAGKLQPTHHKSEATGSDETVKEGRV
ncbi:uncharacterized protein I206_107321 [Kwoniella pini CBS 10737]|uniref:POT family proton-dependent oligopeptide transporter n=1 Tax=Kwoniella pini CBS 10737 TaxID=1296096 RepID=A0A1B9HYP5_9TREE|nr:uncharacterized protein I206_05135 [Kwoniella pini CBS 10737]OCF48358.1 hypothetical protein I206_05135 [Kwoniella pini CBS 10737]